MKCPEKLYTSTAPAYDPGMQCDQDEDHRGMCYVNILDGPQPYMMVWLPLEYHKAEVQSKYYV